MTVPRRRGTEETASFSFQEYDELVKQSHNLLLLQSFIYQLWPSASVFRPENACLLSPLLCFQTKVSEVPNSPEGLDCQGHRKV